MVVNPSKQDQSLVIQSVGQKDANLLIFTGRQVPIMLLHGQRRHNDFVCFEWAGSIWWTCQDQDTINNIANPENTAQSVNAVCEDRHQTIFSLSMVMKMSVSTIQVIVQDLGYCKVCFQWVLCLLTHTHTEQQMSTSVGQIQQHLTQEWWISATDCHGWWDISPFWRHKKTTGQPNQRNPKSQAPARSMISTLFFSTRDPLLLEFKPR